MARLVTMIMRISSICKPHNISLAIAAQVFLNAGVILIFIVNLLFAQRMIRAAHPRLGWHPLFSAFFRGCFGLIVISLVMLITAVVQSFFTLNTRTRRIDRHIQLYGVTMFLVIAFLPIPLVVGGLLIRRREGARIDKFGHGRWREKVAILLTSSVLIAFGAAYRAAVSWHTPVPRTQPMPAYFARPALYVVTFAVEILVVYLYVLVRVDLRFYIPNGAHGPGSYSAGAKRAAVDDEAQDDVAAGVERQRNPSPHRVFSEEETFDDDARLDLDDNSGSGVGSARGVRIKDLEKGDAAGSTSTAPAAQ